MIITINADGTETHSEENPAPAIPTAEEIADAVILAQNENEESDDSETDDSEEIELDEEWLTERFELQAANLLEASSRLTEILALLPPNFPEMMREILEYLERISPKPQSNSQSLPEDQLEETELQNPSLPVDAADLPEAALEQENANPPRVRLI